MKLRCALLTLALVAMALTGCRVSGELENQAYVLLLGLDREEGGRLLLTAKVPQVGKGGASEDSGGGYLTFAADGDGWVDALEALEQTTPRQMNLSHIELIVASEALACEDGFGALITRVAETPHLYTTARFAVCAGRASQFVDGQETVIGKRLSSEIDAMLDHYAEHGYVPKASFADAYYAVNSIYGDPVAIYGETVDPAEEAAALIEPAEGASGLESPMKQRYRGAALFEGGRMVGTLGADQAVLLSLVRGGRVSLPVECSGKRYTLAPEGAVKRGVRIEGARVTLCVEAAFSTLEDVCEADARALEAIIADAVAGVIRACQALRSEPFGFSEAAAVHFATIRDWQGFNWRSRYVDAGIEVSVRIRGSGRD